MVNFVWEHIELDGMIDGSGTGITVAPWNPTITKWSPITTLTPTITRDTVFFHTNTSGVDSPLDLLTVIQRESGWDKFINVKQFTIPRNIYLTNLQATLEAGDTIQIKIHLNNSNGGRATIVLALLYTHTGPSGPTGSSMATVSSGPTGPSGPTGS
jgi:hypothetical protein